MNEKGRAIKSKEGTTKKTSMLKQAKGILIGKSLVIFELERRFLYNYPISYNIAVICVIYSNPILQRKNLKNCCSTSTFILDVIQKLKYTRCDLSGKGRLNLASITQISDSKHSQQWYRILTKNGSIKIELTTTVYKSKIAVMDIAE